jgi:raffinose/stachyose/melibiose transport system substrate-binding protein
MKKVLALLIVALMIIPFAACGTPQEAASTPPDASKEAVTDAPAPATDAPEEQITLTLWSIATESDNYHEPYLKAIADFEAAHPNIKIDFQTFENESYKTKLKSAVSANELPDIFFTWGGGFSQPFVEAGRVLGVDDAYQNYKDALPEVMLTNVTFDGKKYGSVYTMNVSMLFYNKDMFKQYNLKPPTSIDELKSVCQTFIDNGITPFGISAKDKWNLGMAHDALTLKSAGAAAVTSALTKDGKVTYDAPEFLAATNVFSDLVKMGAYSEDAIALTNDEATQTFYDGKVPMYITGSWMVSDFYTKSKTPEAFGCIPVPVVNSANAKLSDFMGGPSDTLMVAASTKYPEEAAMAMFEISQGISKYGYLSGSGIAAWKVDYDASEVKPLTQEIAALVQDATSLTLWFDTLLQAEDANVYLDNLQQLYLGDITPQQVIENMTAQLSK